MMGSTTIEFMTKMRAARARKGWTLQCLGGKVFRSMNTICGYERGVYPVPWEAGLDLSKALGIAAGSLQEESDVPAGNSAELGARFREARKRAGLSSAAVAKRLGIYVSGVYKLEGGGRVSAYTLVSAWDFFGMSNEQCAMRNEQ